MIDVSHHGLHWTEGEIAFLHQGTSVTSLYPGLKSPFRVVGRKASCNHNIDIHGLCPPDRSITMFKRLLRDDLVRAMLPVPPREGRALYLTGTSDDLKLRLICLGKMSWPTRPIVVPFWSVSLARVRDELAATNLQPLVLTDVSGSDAKDLDKILSLVPISPRRLIFAGGSTFIPRPSMGALNTRLSTTNLADIVALPWEQLGAWALRKTMNHEDPCLSA